jgi:hypothetical protein
MTMIDGGATHNFSHVSLVTRRQIAPKDLEEFNLVVSDEYNMEFNQRIRGLEVTLGNYTLTDEFYCIDFADNHVVLGVWWSYAFGYIPMNHQYMRMEFRDKGGK